MREAGPIGVAAALTVVPLCVCLASAPAAADPVARGDDDAPADGIRFRCDDARLATAESDMDAYLASLGIPGRLFTRRKAAHTLTYALRTPAHDTDTLTLSRRPELGIGRERVRLAGKGGKAVETVSKKEIVLALLQHGRLTEFAGDACTVAALKEHVGIRQDTVAWAGRLRWRWPDGGPARWNGWYWAHGAPRRGIALHTAVGDAFRNQRAYAIGCYAASKLTMMQGVLDYFWRVDRDAGKQALAEARLLADCNPLEDVEPGRMWEAEPDFDPVEGDRAGKLLRITSGIPPDNFVPGDWSYFLNTDPATHRKTGFEGSNAIYLGMGRFADYYDENRHGYTFREKLDEVFQWRNGVFSRSRDSAKARPLTARDIERLGRTPREGGLLLDVRATPYYFGFERLPAGTEVSQVAGANATRGTHLDCR